jgi:Tol biopolymer transport system component
MKQTLTTLFFLLFLAACAQEPQLADDGVVTAVSSSTRTITPTATAVPTAAPQPTSTAEPTPLPTVTVQVTKPPTPTPIPTSDLIDGWLLHSSEFYQYQFSYPPEAKISTVGVNGFPTDELPTGMTFDEYIAQLRQIYPDDICVRLIYRGGFIAFAAPPDKGGQYIDTCTGTGVGAYDMSQISETVIIDDQPYTARGWEVRERDDAATWLSEFLSLGLDDGVTITYGSIPDIGLTHEEYLATKKTLLQIMTSFRSRATALNLDDTLILYAAIQDNNWALKTYPYHPAFSGDVFDHFYGPVERMEDVRMYTQFNFGPQMSPNGRYLLLPGVGGYSGPGSGAPPDAENTGLWFVNLQPGETRQLLPRAKLFTWSPYGDRIAYVDGDTLYMLSIAEGTEPQPLFSHPDLWGLYARWSPDGQYVATMTTVQNQPDESGSPELQNTYWLVSVYDQSAVELAERADFAMEYAAENMTWSPTGRYLLVRNQVFDLDGRQLSPVFPGGARWLPASKQLEASGQELLLVNGRDGLIIMTIEGEELVRINDAFVDTWAFSHDGRFLAYLNPYDETDLIIFNLNNGEIQHLGPIPHRFSLQWSTSDDYLLLDDSGRTSPIWALAIEPGSQMQVIVEEGTLIAALPMPVREVVPGTAVPIPTITPTDLTPAEPASGQGPAVLFARDDDLWRADVNGGQIEPLTAGGALHWGMMKPENDAYLAAITRPPHVSPDGRWLAFAPDSWSLSLVDVAHPGLVRQIEPAVPIPAWSPDSRYLAYGTADSVYIYDIEIDILTRLLHAVRPVNVAWSPDMRYLAFACCFAPSLPYNGINYGEIRRVEIAIGQVDIVDASISTIAGGTTPVCWSADGSEVTGWTESTICSYGRPYLYGTSPDGTQHAYLSLRSPDDEEYFRLLVVTDLATEEILWQREVPRVQKLFWSPDGQYLLLGSDGYLSEAAIYRLPADGTAAPELIIHDGYLLGVIPQWQ